MTDVDTFTTAIKVIADVIEIRHEIVDYCVRAWIRLSGEDEACITLDLEDHSYSVQDGQGYSVKGRSGADRWDNIHDALLDTGLDTRLTKI